MRVELSELAESDLLDIALYIAEDNPERAFHFVGELQQACDGLADRSFRFPLLPGFEEKGIRRRVYGRYAVLYTVDAGLVRVLRIVSTAMDFGRLLSDQTRLRRPACAHIDTPSSATIASEISAL